MQPIMKDKLKGHYVRYLETNKQGGATRVEKVIKIIGNWITVKHVLGRKRRINLDRVMGCIHHKKKLRGII